MELFLQVLVISVVVEGEDPMSHFAFTSSSLPLPSTPQHSSALPSTASTSHSLSHCSSLVLLSSQVN
eukprot:scaffold11564_cov180-Ochromonas_danica.AAC.2